MYIIKPSDMESKSKKKHCDINLTKTAVAEKGKSPIFDVEISGGWSIRPTTNQKIIDQIFHFSVFFCLIILACYIIAVHSLVYYETQDTANLENKVDYAFTLHDHLENKIQSLEFIVDGLKTDMNVLKSELEMSKRNCENHVRKQRSVTDQKSSTVQPRKKNRPRTTENVAIQFAPSDPLHYEKYPLEGVVGPWISDLAAIGRNEEAFGVTYKYHKRHIQISRGGLYFIYSQVTYVPSKHHSMGIYSINLIPSLNTTDDETHEDIAGCSVDLGNILNDVTCYTSTVRVLRPNDTLYLQQMTNNSKLRLLQGSTYLGLILLSES